ncbi:hypothetical protein KSF_016100 [Reticulibacter mediterranei]|uniref:Uncharacterized protein n=1 Tax=Reticulibacter mediterranei TaxID=2778369 RepID=A0A8J3N1R6_9CHLR|nr:hypothetical protein KSF_016100 [Reticulibacter mediterranei]
MLVNDQYEVPLIAMTHNERHFPQLEAENEAKHLVAVQNRQCAGNEVAIELPHLPAAAANDPSD